jgi:hypothetical protein
MNHPGVNNIMHRSGFSECGGNGKVFLSAEAIYLWNWPVRRLLFDFPISKRIGATLIYEPDAAYR